MTKGFVGLVLLLAAGLLGSAYIQEAVTSHYVLELYLLIAATLLGMLALIGVGWDKAWGWPLSTVLFSLIALNSLVVYVKFSADMLVFFVVVAVALAGMLTGISAGNSAEEDALARLPRLVFTKPKVAKTVKRKPRRTKRKSKR